MNNGKTSPTEDRVCTTCRGILRWYDGASMYLHIGSRGQFTIRDHAPTPDDFPVMTACGCAALMEGPQPDCRVHGCPECRDLRITGHAYGCLFTGTRTDPDDGRNAWINTEEGP